jgi:iron complex transport system substrate-binding protein
VEAMFGSADAAEAKTVWSALSSLPAVRNNRVQVLTGQYLVVPGPRIAEATEALARTLHPEAFK